MNKIKESFQHHKTINRRYKNLSYIDTHDINEAFKENDKKMKKLINALEQITEVAFVDSDKDAPEMYNIAFDALKECKDV